MIETTPLFEPERPKTPTKKLLADPNRNGMIDASWDPVRTPSNPNYSTSAQRLSKGSEARDDCHGSAAPSDTGSCFEGSRHQDDAQHSNPNRHGMSDASWDSVPTPSNPQYPTSAQRALRALRVTEERDDHHGSPAPGDWETRFERSRHQDNSQHFYLNRNGMSDASWNPVGMPPKYPTSGQKVSRVAAEERDDRHGSPAPRDAGSRSTGSRSKGSRRQDDSQHPWLYQNALHERQAKKTGREDPPEVQNRSDAPSIFRQRRLSSSSSLKTASSAKSVSSCFSKNQLPKRAKSVSFSLPPDDKDSISRVPSSSNASSVSSRAFSEREAATRRREEVAKLSKRQSVLLARGQRILQARSHSSR